jgi:hypothetical protein
MAFFKKLNMKTSKSTTQASMKSHAHRSISEPKGIATENHEQMKNTTGRGGEEVHRRPIVDKDHILKVTSFEILIFDKVCELLVLF